LIIRGLCDIKPHLLTRTSPTALDLRGKTTQHAVAGKEASLNSDRSSVPHRSLMTTSREALSITFLTKGDNYDEIP
jgi:hypothetical protein